MTSFKSVEFHAGLNLVVSEKTPDATGRQTQNSSGKSSLVEVINFVLGAKRSKDWIFDRESIHEEDFSLQFDLGDLRLTATRSGAEHTRIEVDALHTTGRFSPLCWMTVGRRSSWTIGGMSWAKFGLASTRTPSARTRLLIVRSFRTSFGDGEAKAFTNQRYTAASNNRGTSN